MAIEKILVVDDEIEIRELLAGVLKTKGFELELSNSAEKGLKLLADHSFDMIISDMKMPGMSGLEFLRQAKEISPQTLVILMTAFGTIETAVEAMQSGAFNYLIKPFSLENLFATIEKARQHVVLVEENSYLRQQTTAHLSKYPMIAESPAMKKIMHDIEQVARTHANVFITGETGTGKEIVSHFIHYHSPRKNHPFIKVNCAAVPDPLVESEFFGHEKGAFTGAASKRLGRFELAHGGSLLLDEVTEIPLHLQAKLLRITQEQEFERVGGNKTLKVDVRLISTSNRDIEEAILHRLIREDLYYRLSVIPIHLPPLKERREDIILLAHYFIHRTCKENHLEAKKISPEAEKKLLDYSWPGNIRELANVIERAIVMGEGKIIGEELLTLEGLSLSQRKEKTFFDLEKQQIIENLKS